MIFRVNSDATFTLDYADIEELYFCPFLEGILK